MKKTTNIKIKFSKDTGLEVVRLYDAFSNYMHLHLIMRYENFKGLFYYHCLNLENEDMGKRWNFKTQP